MTDIVIIGAGQAGCSAAFKLRQLGHQGRITLIGDEAAPPYQRPPLSKDYLLGKLPRERLFLRPEAAYEENDITLCLGEQVTAIDPEARQIKLSDCTIRYDALIFATGSAPIALPDAIGGSLNGIHYVRTLVDIDAMADEIGDGRKALIVGGGYIGLEAAAVAAQKGLDVTVVEMADRILQRVAAPETSAYFRELHQSHGVKILEGVGLERLEGETRVQRAVLSNGEALDVDFVVAGIGIKPNTQIAELAGLEIDNGIATDHLSRTSDPNIWAAGDCASFLFGDTRIRLESVPNAIDQAELVASNIMGANKTYKAKPWFWSDQYDVKLQIAGLNIGYDRVVTRTADKPGSVSYWYYAGDKLLAVDAMNAPREFMIGRRLIEAGKSPEADLVANTETELKSFM